jgi:hypothetical protein
MLRKVDRKARFSRLPLSMSLRTEEEKWPYLLQSEVATSETDGARPTAWRRDQRPVTAPIGRCEGALAPSMARNAFVECC